jgi:hypothetical protein
MRSKKKHNFRIFSYRTTSATQSGGSTLLKKKFTNNEAQKNTRPQVPGCGISSVSATNGGSEK